MEERHSLIDHKRGFKKQGMKEFADKVVNFIDKSIDRSVTEVDALNQIVTKYKGKKVQIVTAPLFEDGSFNTYTVTIIDWKEEKSKTLPVYKRFLKSPFTSDYIPFAYRTSTDGKEAILLCEILDTPSPWVRTYNDDSSNTWAGHYFGNSLRNCGIIPYTLPERYVGDDAMKLVATLEGLAKENNEAKLKDAGFDNTNHLAYVIELAKGNIQEGMKEAQAFLDEANKQLKQQMDNNIDAAKKGGLLDPIKGVSMEDWAAANVKISQAMPLNNVLKVLGIEKPTWDEVSAEWMNRMSRDTTFAISKVYGDAFTNPNIGKFADAGTSSAATSGGEVDKVKNDFELYIKIMCHQSMGAVQGLDANAVLKIYKLSATDWSMISAHWAPKMTSDLELMMKMSPLMEKYNAEFLAGAPAKAGDGIDF